MRSLARVLVAVAAMTLFLVAASPGNQTTASTNTSPSRFDGDALELPPPTAAFAQAHVHTRPSIDGSKEPEAIPNEVAYSLFLRMTLIDGTPNGAARQRAYVRHVLREAHAGQGSQAHLMADHVVSTPQAPDASDAEALDNEVQSVIATLKELEPGIRELDRQRLSGDLATHDGIAQSRQAMIRHARDAITTRLSQATAERVRWYVEHRFKSKIKIIN